jgi:hypothetical protein
VEGRFVPCVAPGFNCWLGVCAASPVTAFKSARLIKGAQEIYCPGRPHGLTATHQDEVNADLLKFVKSVQQTRKGTLRGNLLSLNGTDSLLMILKEAVDHCYGTSMRPTFICRGSVWRRQNAPSRCRRYHRLHSDKQVFSRPHPTSY